MLVLPIVSKKFTDKLELPGVVPYPEEGSEATDQRRPSTTPRHEAILLIGANANGMGELRRGLSTGLAEYGEWARDPPAAATAAALVTKLRR